MNRTTQAKHGLTILMILAGIIFLGRDAINRPYVEPTITTEEHKIPEEQDISNHYISPVTRSNFEVVAKEQREYIDIRVSHYWPPLGGVNCLTYLNGECVSKMANGRAWQNHVGQAIACPPEWEFGTKIVVYDKEWTCMDRGGMIKYDRGIPWIDMLTDTAVVDYGTIATAEIIRP